MMGILDTLRNLASGSGTRTLPVALADGETEVARAVASFRPGTWTSVGGDLVLTTRQLVFTPLDTRDATAFLTWGLTKAGAAGAIAKAPGRLDGLIEQTPIGGLGDLVKAEAGTDARTFRPPTIVLTKGDGTKAVIGILATRRSRNGDPANNAVRDRMLAQLAAVRPG